MAAGLSGFFEVTGTKDTTAKFFWSETYDTVTNTHILSIAKVQVKFASGYGYSYYLGSSNNNGFIKVNGAQIVRFQNLQGSHYVYPLYKNSYANVSAVGEYAPSPWDSASVAGGSDGTCTAKITFDFSGYEASGAGVNGWRVQGTKDIPLTAVDRSAPTVSCTVTANSSTGFTVRGSASVICDLWEYSIDDGATWAQYSTAVGSSATKTITGLPPNTEYKVKVRARKQSNGVKGSSATTAARTLGGTVLNSVSELVADLSSPTLQMNWTVYNASYTHKLAIKNGADTILTIEGLTGSLGTINKTYILSPVQRTALLQSMANMASFEATYELTSYDGGSQIGNVSKVTAIVKTTATNSKPTFMGFSFADVRSETIALTASDQLLIQGQSELRVLCEAAAATNYATIAKYRVTIGGKTVESSTPTVDFGVTTLSGNVTITVSAVDSRGYTATKTQAITCIPFEPIRLNSWSIRRTNDADETANLVFNGEYSTVTVNGTEQNCSHSFAYRYRKMVDGEQWSVWESAALKSSGGRFDYASTEFGSFDTDYPYEIQLSVSDQLTTSEIYLSIPKGTPLVSYRSKMVGINKMTPTCAFDVDGDAAISGKLTVSTITGLAAPVTDTDAVNKGYIDAALATSTASTTVQIGGHTVPVTFVRWGNVVTMVLQAKVPSSATSTPNPASGGALIAIPAGFRPHASLVSADNTTTALWVRGGYLPTLAGSLSIFNTAGVRVYWQFSRSIANWTIGATMTWII